jgi:V8-like Glu-specific endopeptidase
MKRLAFVVLFLFAGAAFAANSVFVRDAVGVRSYPPPPRLAERAKLGPATELAPAALVEPERIEAMRDWNARGGEPAEIGFTRALPDIIAVRLGDGTAAKQTPMRSQRGAIAASDHGTVVWSTRVHVAGAERLRLHLEHVVLPAEAVLWVYGPTDDVQGFGPELIDSNGTLWAPSTVGDTVSLEVEVPAGAAASFVIREVAELFFALPGKVKADDVPSCLVDSTCTSTSTFAEIANARRAVAHIEMPKGGGLIGICTGGLLNNEAVDSTPYFLTANHCLSDQNTATTAEFFFDFQTPSCNNSSANFKKVIGAQLLASSNNSDFTFLKLNSIPAGRVLLGWTTAAVTGGTKLFRVSHPAPAQDIYPQQFSSTVASDSVAVCNFSGGVAARPRFVYSTRFEGGVYGGSSGSPVMLANGQVVGQLLGGCPSGGANAQDGCDSRVNVVDGAFATTYQSIKQWLSPGNPVQPAQCVENATQVCLVGNRFGVKVAFNDGTAKTATAIKYTADSGLFWFFDQANIEVLVKMINACSFNQRFWVYSGGTTDLEVTITVTDYKSGSVKTYTNTRGKPFSTITDGGAFATCP